MISFKIEGRLKGGPYVAATTQTYRKAIDAAAGRRDFHLTRREELDLAQTFSRGLTPGFLEGINHQKLVRGRFPKSRGMRIGKVVGFGRRRRAGRTVRAVRRPGEARRRRAVRHRQAGGEGTRRPRVERARSRDRGARAASSNFSSKPDAIDLAAIPVGCDVYQTDDPALRKRLEQSYAQDKLAQRVPLRAHADRANSAARSR